jgi:hypothetical protein
MCSKATKQSNDPKSNDPKYYAAFVKEEKVP